MHNKNFRNVVLRIFKHNKLSVDNDKLGLKAGDVYTITYDELIILLDRLAKRKKGLKYFVAVHNRGKEDEHYHIVICCGSYSQITFKTLKNMFPYSFIDSVKYGVKNAVQYLIHMNNPEKEQYSWDIVKTNAPSKLEEYKIPKSEEPKEKIKRILADISECRIMEHEIPSKIGFDLYFRFSSRINKAFDYQKKLIQKMDRDAIVIFIQGPGGLGKTTFAKAYAIENNKSYCLSASSRDPYQNYKSEQVMILDDIKYESIKIEDMLGFLDPHNNRGLSSRFSDKNCIADTIFVISNKTIQEWYKDESPELKHAFLRRISVVLSFIGISEDYVSTYTVNSIDDKYVEDENGNQVYRIDLVPAESGIHTFDAKKYIDVTVDEAKKNAFFQGIAGL